LIVAIFIGSGRVIWEAAVVTTEVKYQGSRLEKVENRLEKVENRLEKVEKRLDSIDGKLDVLIRRAESKGGG
jgi:chaperonin cofactor prefoldin